MKLYLAGNFAIMGSFDEEKKFRLIMGEYYYRLSSFYYKKEADILMNLKEEEINAKKDTIKKS